MAASVTIHHKAFGDPRVAYLARLGGYADGVDSALGKLARLWSVCTELGSDTPALEQIRACLGGPKGDEWLVESGLGERLSNGMVRVRGRRDDNGKDRIGWKAELDVRRQQGGRARASNAQRDAKGRLLPKRLLDRQLDNAGPASPAAARYQDQDQDQDQTLSGDPDLGSDPVPSGASGGETAIGSRGGESPPPSNVLALPPRTPPPGIPNPGGQDRRRRLNHDAWAYAALEHARLRGEGIEPDAIPWPAMPAGAPMGDLVKRTGELLGMTDPPDYEAAKATLRRRIDVAVAEAIREQHLRWFTPTRLWDEKGFWRALEFTPEQASQRAGPRGSPTTPDPPRRIKTL